MVSLYTDKTEITHAEYLQLLGLGLLAKNHTANLLDIVSSASALVGEKDNSGHAADEMWSDDPSIDTLLERLSITVRKPEGNPEGTAE